MFVHMLKCISEKRPHVQHVLPAAEMTKKTLKTNDDVKMTVLEMRDFENGN